ncbi:ATP-binding protein [Tundrisphaera lichenicola]|uniref:ATP-binding protein n=1 Tax=Tundrisphaera lichenicola TaxID=2029860 RepID=UPI003EBEBEB2
MSDAGHQCGEKGGLMPGEGPGNVGEEVVLGLGTGDEAARRAAESGARRYRFLAKAIPQIVWTASASGMIDSFNPRWTEYTGLVGRRGPDRGWLNSLHHEDIRRWLEGWERSVTRVETLSIDLRIKRADGTYRWHLTRALPVLARSGRLLKWLGTCTDIDDQKRAEGMLGFLAEVSKVLASTLDYESTLTAVARLAVPHVADWCVVDMLERDGSTRRLAVAHSDPAQVELGWELARRYPPTPGGVLATGRSEIIIDLDDSALSEQASDGEHLAMLRAQGCNSSISAALAARGRTLGVISFAMAESGRRYTRADLPLVEDLARRAAMAVDNARLYREARQAREESEASNRAKDRFLAVLSHELRTPLTPVLAEASAMLDDPATPEAIRPFLEMTRRNVLLEARLIDDLLDLSRISQGKLRLSLEAIDAHRLIVQVVEICRPDAEAAGIRLELDLGAAESHVRADPARLQQVSWNLIKNAVKFTPEGGLVTIRTRNSDARLFVDVIDTGAGIDSESLARIFDAFEQGGDLVTQRFGGLGLGLAIGRSLAQAHGGRLIADSKGLGLGATFTLELPTIEVPSGAEVPTIDKETLPSGPLRILLVEDDAVTLKVMARLLVGRGHDVATAETVASASLAVEQSDFDLLISDLGLPDGSGLDLIQQLRARGPILGIALTGHGMDGDIQRSFDAGFTEHLTKPIDFKMIEEAIDRVIAGREMARD